MESQCIRVKLKPGKTEQFLDWALTLKSREDEVGESLKLEGLNAEFLFLERAQDGDYVTLYTRGRDLAAANRAFEKSKLPLDQEAKKVMAETWDFTSVTQLERLLEFTP